MSFSDLPPTATGAPAPTLARAEVRLLSLPMRQSLATAHDSSPAPDRLLAVVGVETVDGAIGWGECSALNEATYTSESATTGFDLLSRWAEGGPVPNATESPMTHAAIEMALTDVFLRAAGVSLASQIGAVADTVDAGATIGLLSVEDSVARVGELVAGGYRRVKVKIDPTQVDNVPHELSHEFPDLEIQVDANGSLDESHLMALLSLTKHGVTAIEQPFPVDRVDLAADLVAVTDATIVADESVASLADALVLLQAQALGAISIKAPRLGGLAAALDVLKWCGSNQLGASAGGMLESGLGRHALAALAACEGFTITGDLSLAGQWLRHDPWPDLVMEAGSISVPTGPGVAPLPDLETLDRFTVRRTE